MADEVRIDDEHPASRQVRRRRAREEAKSAARSRPDIDAGDHDLPRVTQQALEALIAGNEPPSLFRLGGLPVRIERDERGTPTVRPVNEHMMRYHLARFGDWYERKPTRTGTMTRMAAWPPVPVVRDVLAHPNLPLPPLSRIVEAPVFDRCGGLCDSPGYSGPASGIYYAPSPDFHALQVPMQPTASEVATARGLLLTELFGDFPFVGESEKANAVALALLPFARDLIDGPTPLHLIEKPTPGTGATLLVDAGLWPALGRSVPVMTEGRDEDEWRKRITAKLSASPSVILIDNLRRRLDSAALSGALTAHVWEDRILSLSTTMRAPVRCLWVATGNNPALSNEITRRSVRIRLDAGVDRPWLRNGFRHPDLRRWMTEHRPALVAAALTLIQAWLHAGRPPGPRTMGHFEAWAIVMGGILSHVEIPGFLANLESFYDASDDETATWVAFVTMWRATYQERAVGVADLFRLLGEDVTLDLGDKGDRSQRTRLGKLLGRMRDRVFAGYRVVDAGREGKLQRWRLQEESAGTLGTSGTFPNAFTYAADEVEIE